MKIIMRERRSAECGLKDLLLAIVIISITGFIAYLIISPNFIASMKTNNPASNTVKFALNLPTTTSIEESRKDIDYVNSIRSLNGVSPIKSDSRVYNLGLARVNDMDKYEYLDHTNPSTGTCAYSLKSQFGLTSIEYVAENAFGFPSGGSYYTGIEKDAINDWMSDRGHKYNMLYPHVAGAVACSSGGHCVFLGLNYNRFMDRCSTATQGEAFWATVGKQPYEHI